MEMGDFTEEKRKNTHKLFYFILRFDRLDIVLFPSDSALIQEK